jgi:GT2 family glycosyltransferase
MDAAGNLVTSPRMAAVVIGRNEGVRLEESLRSVQAAGLPLLYADSGSMDQSVALGRRLGVPVLSLDPALPFSAGRGRNEGLVEAIRHWPNIDYVLFLDGDCVLDPSFPAAACTCLDQHPLCAIVTGHLTERHPDASIYNRLCAIEWHSPAGQIHNMNALGGIMVVRISAFRRVGGFDLDAIAGEEPDLGVRLLEAGYSIIKIDRSMATHDAHIFTFRQWWTRAIRSGHALAHRYARHGQSSLRDGRREIFSTLLWGFGLPLVIVALLRATHWLSLSLIAAYVILGWRVRQHYIRLGFAHRDAQLVAPFIICGKFAQVIGIVRYGRNRLRRRFEIIEYK